MPAAASRKLQEGNINAFFAAYPRLAAWRRQAMRHVERTGAIATPAGRVRTVPKDNGYLAISTIIPGGTAEVLLAAFGVLSKHLHDLDAKLVDVVHDELLLKVREDHAETARRAVVAAMIEGMLANFPSASVNGLVEAKTGRNWAEAK
jgi:DNA polymerase I-like protein with 3'-5' exonuclease and polymerase domains